MYIGRIAPSPTGYLHLGHARTFWIAHQRALAAQGQLWLRDDDLDPQRSRPHFAAAMREDLHWLGIHWCGEIRQSQRLPLYLAAIRQLLAAGLAYPCTCTRRELAAAALSAPHDEDDEPLYSGRCRPPQPRPLSTPPRSNLRLRIPTDQPITFHDAHAGPQTFLPGRDFGDFLLWRRPLTHSPDDLGLPSYQLASVLDDADLRITEVVRGADLLKSTARQILLQRALGLPTPAYFHCDLLRDSAGLRLAKRHDALSLRTLRDAGLQPAEILRGWT